MQSTADARVSRLLSLLNRGHQSLPLGPVSRSRLVLTAGLGNHGNDRGLRKSDSPVADSRTSGRTVRASSAGSPACRARAANASALPEPIAHPSSRRSARATLIICVRERTSATRTLICLRTHRHGSAVPWAAYLRTVCKAGHVPLASGEEMLGEPLGIGSFACSTSSASSAVLGGSVKPMGFASIIVRASEML
jgi:hypothetical protein